MAAPAAPRATRRARAAAIHDSTPAVPAQTLTSFPASPPRPALHASQTFLQGGARRRRHRPRVGRRRSAHLSTISANPDAAITLNSKNALVKAAAPRVLRQELEAASRRSNSSGFGSCSVVMLSASSAIAVRAHEQVEVLAYLLEGSVVSPPA